VAAGRLAPSIPPVVQGVRSQARLPVERYSDDASDESGAEEAHD
jgi:hypothetical protein